MSQVTPIPPVPHPYTAEGGDNEEVVLQVNGEFPCRLLWVGVAYNANVTKNVTVKYMSPLGGKYNVKAYTIAITAAKDGFWLVNGDFRITAGDYIEVKAPAGGEGVKATITAMAESHQGADALPYARLIEGSVGYAEAGTIGAMPPAARLVGIEIEVLTGFNSDGSNLLSIGHDADNTAYTQGIDVSTARTVKLALIKPAESVVRVVKAYYTAGGSAATAGNADVTVKYEV